MKKFVFVALIAVLVLGLAGIPLAATVNGEFKASYLVWPKIVNTGDEDTVITIFNDGSGPVGLHCFWMDEYQVPFDFEFEITRFQTVWFKASDGNGMQGTKAVEVSPFHGQYGELKCFAVDDNDLPITKNNSEPAPFSILSREPPSASMRTASRGRELRELSRCSL